MKSFESRRHSISKVVEDGTIQGWCLLSSLETFPEARKKFSNFKMLWLKVLPKVNFKLHLLTNELPSQISLQPNGFKHPGKNIRWLAFPQLHVATSLWLKYLSLRFSKILLTAVTMKNTSLWSLKRGLFDRVAGLLKLLKFQAWSLNSLKML